jgi:hypothetical protein
MPYNHWLNMSPDLWSTANPSAHERSISPPHDMREAPRAGYYPGDYASINRAPTPEPVPSPKPAPPMYATMRQGPESLGMPGGGWYDSEEDLPAWRKPEHATMRRGPMSYDMPASGYYDREMEEPIEQGVIRCKGKRREGCIVM